MEAFWVGNDNQVASWLKCSRRIKPLNSGRRGFTCPRFLETVATVSFHDSATGVVKYHHRLKAQDAVQKMGAKGWCVPLSTFLLCQPVPFGQYGCDGCCKRSTFQRAYHVSKTGCGNQPRDRTTKRGDLDFCLVIAGPLAL